MKITYNVLEEFNIRAHIPISNLTKLPTFYIVDVIINQLAHFFSKIPHSFLGLCSLKYQPKFEKN